MESGAIEAQVNVSIPIPTVNINIIESDVLNVSEEIVNQVSESSSIMSDSIDSSLIEEEPAKKKIKTEATSNSLTSKSNLVKEKLEQRLGGILCCAVCLDLPKSAIFQCTNGHLMCAGCFTHLLADARLRDETASCPNCRCVISRDLCSRNLAVEKAVCELPGQCRFCGRELPRALLDKHEDDQCDERIVRCRFARIGCPWRGPNHESGISYNIITNEILT